MIEERRIFSDEDIDEYDLIEYLIGDENEYFSIYEDGETSVGSFLHTEEKPVGRVKCLGIENLDIPSLAKGYAEPDSRHGWVIQGTLIPVSDIDIIENACKTNEAKHLLSFFRGKVREILEEREV